MMNADMGGNDGAVEVGKSGDSVLEHESVQDEAQGSEVQEATGAENVNANATGIQQGTAPEFVADQWGLKFRGKTIVPKTRDELINWAQLGYNYNKRNSELTENEKRLKEQETRYGQLSQLSELFDSNPEFKKSVYDIYNKFASGQPVASQQGEQGNADPLVQQLNDKIAQLESKLGNVETGYKSWEEKQAGEAVEKEMAGLKESHKDEDWTAADAETGDTLEIEVLKHADKNGFKSLEAAYRDLRWDNMQAQIKAQALKDAEAARLQEARAGTVSKGGSAQMGTQQKTIPRSTTYDQLSQMAVASMR